MGGWITLGILVLLAVLPLGIRVLYDREGVRLAVIAGPVKITLFPRPVKKKKEKKPSPDKKTQAAAEKQPEEKALPKPPEPPKPEKKPSGGSLADFVPFVKLAVHFLGDFRRKLRMDRLNVQLVLAGGDPCDLAVNYGKTWAAVGNLLPALERWFVIRKKDIRVGCDFTAAETLVAVDLMVTITLGRLLWLAAVYAVRALQEYLNFKKKRKGGAVT